MTTGKSCSQQIRERLDHPIIDSDGHTAEFEPLVLDAIRDIGGPEIVDRYKNAQDNFFAFPWYRYSPEERQSMRIPRPLWWVHPTENTLDRATSSLPKLMNERIEEMGLDYSMIYPSLGMIGMHMRDEEVRHSVCRAFNQYHAESYGAYPERMTPAAMIPMHTPDEAIEALEHAVSELGMKVVLMAGYVRRPLPGADALPKHLQRTAIWLDTFGIDSLYDYDPVWAKCLELGVVPTFHSGGMGWGSRNSTSNLMYNHIGHFAAAGEAICKSLFFGGVTRRFPELRFTFLEGGVGWACALYNDLIGHWEKHNVESVQSLNPAKLDNRLMRELFERYAGPAVAKRLDDTEDRSELLWGRPESPEDLDEWAHCNIGSAEDVRDLFVPRFYFGCEGDDRLTGWAFDRKKNALGAALRPIYGSDIGHFDLSDMRGAAAEAWELVENGILDEDAFRDFVFTNPVRLKAEANPDFFKGSAVEDAVQKLLSSGV